MNILLVMPKALSKSSGFNVFSIGIAYVSSRLKRAGYDVTTRNLEYRPESTMVALRQLIERHGIDVVCTSGLSRDFHKVKEVVDCTRTIDTRIRTVVGGGIITSDPETALATLGADIGVVGEGEITACELMDALRSHQPLDSIPGLVFRDGDGHMRVTESRKEVGNIDDIAFPDYEGFAFSQYMTSIDRAAVYIIASRSCPYSCTFCFHPSGKKYRQRSLDNLFAEIEYLFREYSPRHLSISDELFSASQDRVMEFCERIRRLKILWSAQLRVDNVDRELLKVMRSAGCVGLSYGLESADDSVLKSMRKHITVAQIEKALRLTHEMEIDIQGGFIFGDIQETMETAKRTIAWHAKHPEYGAELNMIQVFPGTPLYHSACQRNIIADKARYLMEGCPLINVSKLSKEEFKWLASWVYENNMRSKYAPNVYRVLDVQKTRQCKVEIQCNKCGETSSFDADFLFIQRINCPRCLQRYYLDPFQKALIKQDEIERHFQLEESVAMWGAGEICIKLLDNYPCLKNVNFILVDAGSSRQGLTLCGKLIESPEEIGLRKIKKAIVAAVNRGDEIVQALRMSFPSVERVYLPDIEVTPEGVVPVLRESMLNHPV